MKIKGMGGKKNQANKEEKRTSPATLASEGENNRIRGQNLIRDKKRHFILLKRTMAWTLS